MLWPIVEPQVGQSCKADDFESFAVGAIYDSSAVLVIIHLALFSLMILNFTL